jgi:hypothetical protein
MILTSKIKYQLFLYNYFLQYIKKNLYIDYYNEKNKDKCIQKINILTNEIKELEEINNYEFIKYKKSRGKRRKHKSFLLDIRKQVLDNKKSMLSKNITFMKRIDENKNKFKYKDYDDYFCKHVNYYNFVQKIKSELKNKYDIRVENICKNTYTPKIISELLKIDTENDTENDIEIDDVFLFLDKKLQNIMYNIF